MHLRLNLFKVYSAFILNTIKITNRYPYSIRCYKELAFLLSASFRVRTPVGIMTNTKKASIKEAFFVLVIPTGLACLLCSLRLCVLARQKPHRHTPVCLSSLSNPFLWVRIKLNFQYKNTLHKGGCFCIGDPNAMNFELWLTKEYYQATMETYQLAKVFLENNRDYQSLIHLIN